MKVRMREMNETVSYPLLQDGDALVLEWFAELHHLTTETVIYWSIVNRG